jgi:NAD-dependent dihydropyrimidine dehydrogenase PreA subunit
MTQEGIHHQYRVTARWTSGRTGLAKSDTAPNANDDGRPTFDTVPQLYIDPVECIDCGACVPVCPVSAIFALDDLPEKWKEYTELNESYVKAGKFTPEEFAKHQGK